MKRLGIRTRLLAVVVAAVAAGLGGAIAAFNLLLDAELSHSASDRARDRATAELALLRPVGGRLVLGEAPDDAAADAPVWVFASGRTLEAPSAGSATDEAARRLAGGPARFAEVAETDTRLYATPVVAGGRRLGTVVAAVSLAPYEETRRTALIGSLALSGVLLALVALAARWLLASSLRPVARMTSQAAAWSEHDLDSRFELGEPRDELTQLGATLDGLLDRLAASLRREHRFSAELSHELRTPLARVIGEAELALRRERTPAEYRAALEVVHRSAHDLARTVEALVAAARLEADGARGTADAFAVAERSVSAFAELAAERGLELEAEAPPRPVRLGVEADFADRTLRPLVENACRYGRSRVRVSVARSADGVRFAVRDDGPGVPVSERTRIFEPGARGAAASKAGAGLGLALARRLARSAAGDVELAEGGDGTVFVLRLPAA